MFAPNVVANGISSTPALENQTQDIMITKPMLYLLTTDTTLNLAYQYSYEWLKYESVVTTLQLENKATQILKSLSLT